DSCSELSSDEDLSSARIFTEVDVKNPPVPCHRFKFSGIPSVHVQFDDTSDVLQFYETFIDFLLMSKIVEETNKYAKQCIQSSVARHFSKNDSCSELSSDEDLSSARIFTEVDVKNPPVPYHRFKFSGIPSVYVQFDDTSDVLQFYETFIDFLLMSKIVEETNKYAKQCIQSSVAIHFSKNDPCSELSSDEDLSSARIFTEVDVKNPPVPCHRFKFSGIPSVHVQFDDTSDVLQFYETFIDFLLMSKIVEETNKYAKQCIQSSVARHFSKNDSCSELSSDEDLSSARIFTEVDVKNPPVPYHRFKFSGIPSVHVQFDDTSDVLQFYETFIDFLLMSKIVEETNKYAKQCIQSSVARHFSKVNFG
ncbi:DDE_Tnp_1_7 domain-containing protein, partial [Trichonephila clavata]